MADVKDPKIAEGELSRYAGFPRRTDRLADEHSVRED